VLECAGQVAALLSTRAQQVLVGRPFPPLATHARVSIGTMDEMRAATEVFARVLSKAAT